MADLGFYQYHLEGFQPPQKIDKHTPSGEIEWDPNAVRQMTFEEYEMVNKALQESGGEVDSVENPYDPRVEEYENEIIAPQQTFLPSTEVQTWDQFQYDPMLHKFLLMSLGGEYTAYSFDVRADIGGIHYITVSPNCRLRAAETENGYKIVGEYSPRVSVRVEG